MRGIWGKTHHKRLSLLDHPAKVFFGSQLNSRAVDPMHRWNHAPLREEGSILSFPAPALKWSLENPHSQRPKGDNFALRDSHSENVFLDPVFQMGSLKTVFGNVNLKWVFRIVNLKASFAKPFSEMCSQDRESQNRF